MHVYIERDRKKYTLVFAFIVTCDVDRSGKRCIILRHTNLPITCLNARNDRNSKINMSSKSRSIEYIYIYIYTQY